MVQTCSSRTKTTLNILTQGIQLHLVLELLTDRLMTESPKSTTNSKVLKNMTHQERMKDIRAQKQLRYPEKEREILPHLSSGIIQIVRNSNL